MWFYVQNNRIFLRLRVQPNARSNEILGIVNDQLKLRIAAPPIDNKANEAVVSFIAKKLLIQKSLVSVFKGESSKDKIIVIDSHEQKQEELLKIVRNLNSA